MFTVISLIEEHEDHLPTIFIPSRRIDFKRRLKYYLNVPNKYVVHIPGILADIQNEKIEDIIAEEEFVGVPGLGIPLIIKPKDHPYEKFKVEYKINEESEIYFSTHIDVKTVTKGMIKLPKRTCQFRFKGSRIIHNKTKAEGIWDWNQFSPITIIKKKQ